MTFGPLALAAMFVVAAIGGFAASEATLAADGKPRIVVTPGPPQPVFTPSPEFIPTPPAPLQGFPPSRIEPLPPLVIYTTPLVVVPPHSGQGARK
jgi:hypothetical protein